MQWSADHVPKFEPGSNTTEKTIQKAPILGHSTRRMFPEAPECREALEGDRMAVYGS
jgi:hypothetical protein